MQISIIFLALLSITMADDDYEDPPEYTRTPLGDKIDVSTMKLLQVMYEASAKENLVASPLSLMMVLSLYSEGAGPETKAEITKFLGGSDAKQTGEWYKKLSDSFSKVDGDNLSVANKVSVSNKYNLDEKFAAIAREYHTEFDKLDFTKPAEAAAIINNWASNKTKGHISEPIGEDTLSPDTVAALFNVIYFNGHWHVPFKAEETKEKDFHVTPDSVVKKPMMHLLQPLYYAESTELGAEMIELPYKETGFRMVIVRPNEKDGLPSVLKKAAQRGLLTDVFNLGPIGSDVDFSMPKFDIRTSQDLNSILPEVGVKKIYQESATGIVKDGAVQVNKVFQEAFVTVNEEGATAGAFTGVVIVPVSSVSEPPPPKEFHVDRPFLFGILFEDKLLFVGAYTK